MSYTVRIPDRDTGWQKGRRGICSGSQPDAPPRQPRSRCFSELPYAKLPFKDAQDGISNTFSIIPGALGKEDAVYMSDISLDDLSFSMEPDCACEEPNLTDDREEEM